MHKQMDQQQRECHDFDGTDLRLAPYKQSVLCRAAEKIVEIFHIEGPGRLAKRQKQAMICWFDKFISVASPWTLVVSPETLNAILKTAAEEIAAKKRAAQNNESHATPPSLFSIASMLN
jgi:hypothetical protein